MKKKTPNRKVKAGAVNTIVSAIQCDFCRDVIFSRARHDMRHCSCGAVAIDGGFDYCKIMGTGYAEIFQIGLKATQKELYDDWNCGTDKFGREPGEWLDNVNAEARKILKNISGDDL